MKKYRLIAFLLLNIFLIMTSIGCKPGPLQFFKKGKLEITVQFPSQFKTALIKPETQQILVAIYGTNISIKSPMLSSPLTAQNPKVKLVTPLGKQTVLVAAYDKNNQILTAGKAKVTVVGHTRAEVELVEKFEGLFTAQEKAILDKTNKQFVTKPQHSSSASPNQPIQNPSIELQPDNSNPTRSSNIPNTSQDSANPRNTPGQRIQLPAINLEQQNALDGLRLLQIEASSHSITIYWRDTQYQTRKGYQLNVAGDSSQTFSLPIRRRIDSFKIENLRPDQQYDMTLTPILSNGQTAQGPKFSVVTSDFQFVQPKDKQLSVTQGSKVELKAKLRGYINRTRPLKSFEVLINGQPLKGRTRNNDLQPINRNIRSAQFVSSWNTSKYSTGSYKVEYIARDTKNQIAIKTDPITVTLYNASGSSVDTLPITTTSASPQYVYQDLNTTTDVLINGVNTFQGTKVFVGTTEFATQYINDTQVKITVPATFALGTYNVTLKSPNQTQSTLTNGLKVTRRIFVNTSASGSNNGGSWSNAFTDLQNALTAATTGMEIWVASGTYRPAAAAGPRGSTFQLKSGVDTYGGFSGIETLLSQQNPTANVTILSGDLNGDDVVFANNTENVYHVVTGADNVTLDGFTIQGARADGAGADSFGGGLKDGTNMRLNALRFDTNRANRGAGIYWQSGTHSLTNMTFNNNLAVLEGGGIYALNSSVNFDTATFSTNQSIAPNGGAGIHANNTTLTVNNGTFMNSICGGGVEGGGIKAMASSSVIVRNSNFNTNNCFHGGGIAINASTLLLENDTFTSNSSSQRGGAIYAISSSLTINDTNFNTNTATHSGGAIWMSNTSSTMNNVNFNTNSITGTAAGGGGAIRHEAGGNDNWTNVTFTNNSITANSRSGGAVNIFNIGTLNLTNGTFTNNSSDSNAGAIRCETAICNITSSTFTTNNTPTNGGAIHMPATGGTINITNSTFNGNTATDGGGISVLGGNLTVNGSTFQNNTVTSDGGGLYASGGTQNIDSTIFLNNTSSTAVAAEGGAGVRLVLGHVTTITNSIFDGNQCTNGAAGVSGGGLIDTGNGVSSLLMQNALFVRNSAHTGGAMRLSNGSSATLNGVTIVRNSSTIAAVRGAGLPTTVMRNTIIYFNTGPEIVNSGTYTGTTTIRNSIIQTAPGGPGFNTNATVQIGLDPLFFNTGTTNADILGPDGQYRTSDDGFNLTAGSPAQARTGGTATGALAVDITGAVRPQGGGYSMGAYERN